MFSVLFTGNFVALFRFKLFAKFPLFENAERFTYNFIVVLLAKVNENLHFCSLDD